MIKDKPVILFDGVCNLCNNSVQFILKRDKRNQFLFGSLQGDYGQALMKKLEMPSDHLHSFLLQENDKVYTRSTAALRVLKILGGKWRLLYSFIIVPEFIRDGIYRFIAQNRYRWFGKRDECWIPDAKWKDRFLQ